MVDITFTTYFYWMQCFNFNDEFKEGVYTCLMIDFKTLGCMINGSIFVVDQKANQIHK